MNQFSSFSGHQGGGGKTTSSVNLESALALLGYVKTQGTEGAAPADE
jgi:MinD-like ATPase involved in chromosome partitioning or flagellar assembly